MTDRNDADHEIQAPDDREPQDLGRRLDDLAAVIPSVGVDDARADVRRATDRRRTRTRMLAGAGAVAVVGLIAAAALTLGGDDPDSIVSSDDTAPTSTAPDEPDDTVDAPEPTLDLPIAAAQSVEIIEGAARVVTPAGANGGPEFGEWVVPWEDGFLVGATAFPSQPLPDELPEEVTALFPQEVTDLFGGNLPDTISEATEQLSDAGLLDVVTQIIQDNPAAYDAIYGVPRDASEAPTLDVRFTTDGSEWEQREMTLPVGASYLSSVRRVGDRLAAVYQVQDPLTGRPLDGTITVATTTDLATWSSQEVVVPSPGELPDGVNWTVYGQQLAGNDNGWVLAVDDFVDVDPFVLLPAEDREVIEGGNGFGVNTDDIGVTIEYDFDDTTGTPRQSRTYTWDELGIAPDVASLLVDQVSGPTVWSATWDGVPAPTDAPLMGGLVVATPSGFVYWTDQTWFSPDGTTWTPGPLPAPDSFVTDAFEVDGGVIVMSSTNTGEPLMHRVDEQGGAAVALDIAGLPETVSGGGGWMAGNGGTILDAQAQDFGDPVSVEADGYELTILQPSGVFQVIEVATGDVIVSENPFRSATPEDSPITFDDEGVTVTDPETDEVIVLFPAALLDAAQNERFGDGGDEYTPDFWLLASVDGERFLVDDLDDNFDGPMALAANGDRLLVQSGSEWVFYDLS